MTDREKLIELRREGEEIAENFCVSRQECCQCPYNTPNGCQEGLIADHLIANGVTVQQWIPVTERLPQEDKPMDLVNDLVQVLLKSGAVTVGFYQRQQKTWYVTPECMSYYAIATEEEEVRAWRPLAEPPKGE